MTCAAPRVWASSRVTDTDDWHTHADFATVLELKPGSTETEKALNEVLVLMRECNEEAELNEQDFHPLPTDSKFELESVSNSSDWNHEGNGFL